MTIHALRGFAPKSTEEDSRFSRNWKAKDAEIKAAYEQIKKLEAALNECREYIEQEVDVVDGDYGEPAPNKAMQLVTMIDETLYGPGGF